MYGQFQNPYNNPYSVMQNRLSNLEQQYQQYKPQMPTVLNGRMVTGIEEARASQIALDGTPSYFPSPAENKIYVKSLDMNGLPVFATYKLEVPISCERTQETEQNVSISQFISRIETLEQKVKEMENRESNANITNA